MCARETVNPQAFASHESHEGAKRHKQKEKDEFVQDADFAAHLSDSKSISGGMLYKFGDPTFVPISWACTKQTAGSHCSTEAEVISLDTGLEWKEYLR